MFENESHNDQSVKPERLQLRVIGGTGFVGMHLYHALSQDDRFEALYVVHRTRPEWLPHDCSLLVNLQDRANLQTALPAGSIVINLLRPDGEGWFAEAVDNIVNACGKARVYRYIHVSSIDVFGKVDSSPVTAKTAIAPVTPYELEHAAAEEVVKSNSADMDIAIARLGAVFGPGGRNIVSFVDEVSTAPLFKLALRRSLYGNRRMHLVSVERALEALLFISATQHLLNKRTFLITDDDAEENNFSYLQDRLMHAFGRRLVSAPRLPWVLLRILLKLRGVSNSNPTRRFEDLQLQTMGFRPKTRFVDQLNKYIAFLRKNA